MEAVNFVNKLKMNNSFFTIDLNPHLLTPTEEEDEDMEDSFFDLNIFTESNSHSDVEDEAPQKHAISGSKEEIQNLAKPVDKDPLYFSQLGLAFSSDFISRRKIIPIEPISKPQSPMEILKSAPNFSVFTFKKQKLMAAQKTEMRECKKSQKPETKQKMERGHAFKSNRKNSVRRNPEESLKCPSKRFSKEAMNKYLKLIKPLYTKVSKIYSKKDRSFQNLSPASSPASKHFRKSKSASAATGLSFPALNRRDDSLLLQVDGIQSAILHCKRSYDASRDSTSSSSSFCSDYLPLENPRNSSSRDILGHELFPILRR